jgi:hypothetical protein
MAERLWWLYGVVALPAAAPPGLAGVDGEPVELVEEAGLAALAGAVPAEGFAGAALERRLEDLQTVGALARAHDAVLHATLAERDVLPFAIFTLYESRDAVRAMLADQRERLSEALARVRDAVELGLKAFALPRREERAARPASGAEYLARRLAQRREGEASEDRLERSLAELHSQLERHASAAVLLRPQDRRLSGREHEMVLNVAYLVPRSEAPGFGQLAEGLLHRDDIALEVTGPWPPYHFAEAGE